MEQNLINRKEVLDFLEEDYGFWEYIRMISPRVGIDENEAIELADEVRLTIRDTIESMPVIEERKSTTCNCYTTMPGDYPIYQYFCGECSEWIESKMDDEEYKFCPYCGAKYEKIVRH